MQTKKTEKKQKSNEQPVTVESTELGDVTGGCAACGNAACCTPATPLNRQSWR
jgi:hypothetical protein